jgi:ferric-dicitrate binding protein FerR (iron transport regulator)
VTLPDGSRVWLNAATALRFPTAFTGKDRTVELTGEAYFEIAPLKDQPFRVKVGEMTVDVLGTHFNVMAYDDEESFHTTLLTGAVRVEGGKTARLLKPGEEARLSLDTKDLLVAEADTDQVVAWKNGLFQFEGATLKEVMRQVARWYDVDVHYAGTIEKHFSGFIARKAPLADVLHLLERTGKTSFTLEGRTVTVKPK